MDYSKVMEQLRTFFFADRRKPITRLKGKQKSDVFLFSF